MSVLRSLALAAAIASVLAPFGLSQTITGSLTGTVVDASGAVVPGVKVTASNTATNLTHSTTTNEAGVYNVLFLPAGNYKVAAESAGFKMAQLGPFSLEMGQIARVDIKMEVGEITQAVEITSVAPILQTESTQTGDTISSTQSVTLPLNGRNFVSLTLLVPGAVTPDPSSITAGPRAFSDGRPYVNGNREQGNNFLLDGMDINDTIGNVVGYNPSPDALSEMKVGTGNHSAEFGNASGATVSMTLKSGTNGIHGDLFEFLRNNALDATDFFTNRSGGTNPAFARNVYGGTLGGPIVKDKAFFFVDYQGTRQRQRGSTSATVIPVDFRTGNLARYPTAIKDPLTGTPFPGNQIPLNRIVNPVAKALFASPQLYPLPNNPGTGSLKVTNDYLSSSGNFYDNDQADAKIDYRLSSKDYLAGRFTIARYGDGASQVALPVLLGVTWNAPTTGGVTSWTRTISPTTVNEARVGFTRVVIINQTTDPAGLLGANGNANMGISGGQPIAGMSSVTIGDGFTALGSAASDKVVMDNTYSYGDNLTRQSGRHLLKMGFQALRCQQSDHHPGNNGVLGLFTYTGSYTGSAYADFLLDKLSSKGRGSPGGLLGQRQWKLATFFQDDFKLRPDLTLNLGLRWEYVQPLYEVADRETNINLTPGQNYGAIEYAGKNGNSRALYNSYYKQFMPRVGMAWTPAALKNKFVIRTGYAISSFMEGTGWNQRLTMNPPNHYESNIVYDLNSPGSITSGFADVATPNGFSGQARAWDPNLRPALTQEWNFTGEYQFSSTFSLTAAYVGQRGRHLVDPRYINQPLAGTGPVSSWAPLQTRRPFSAVLPAVSSIVETESSGTMDYNGLQVGGRKRLSGGLEFITSYTMSNCLTDAAGYYGSAGVSAESSSWQNAYNRRADRGFCFFDARHNFTVGGSYALPVGRDRTHGRKLSRGLDYVVGGWTVSYMVAVHSGFPVTINSIDESNQNDSGGTAIRPNRYGPLTYANQSIDNWFGTGNTFCGAGVYDGKCAYGLAALGNFGNSSKATERAPDFSSLQTSIGKQFVVTESKYFELRGEFFNVLNHANFGPPARSISSPTTFGAITSSVGGPRNIALALKFWF
jgi:hypothetical protein